MHGPKKRNKHRLRCQPCRDAPGRHDKDYPEKHLAQTAKCSPNGLICLKGGELEHEAMPFKHKTSMHNLNEDFDEEFFQTKKVVYVTI